MEHANGGNADNRLTLSIKTRDNEVYEKLFQ
jgi:hypothetical protein